MPIWSPAFFGSGAGSSGYVVEDSIWLDGSADYLTFTPSGAGNRRAWSASVWIKKADAAGGDRTFFSGDSSGAGALRHANGDALQFDENGGTQRLTTSAIYRDYTAWQNVVAVWDSDDSTSGDRMRIFINGARVTSFSSETQPSINTDSSINQASVPFVVGAGADSGPGQFFKGSISSVVFLDGTASEDASEFGEYDDNGVWVPINPSGLTYGTNGFLLQFKETGSGQNASGIGADTSGRNNHFAVGGGSIQTNQITDSPTDSADDGIGNYATLNPLDLASSTVLSNGNLRVTSGNNYFDNNHAFSTIAMSTGKFYFTSLATDTGKYIGIANASIAHDIATANDIGIYWDSSAPRMVFWDGSSNNNLTPSPTEVRGTDQFGIALNATNGEYWVGWYDISGSAWYWYNTSATNWTGNPDSNSGKSGTLSGGPYRFLAGCNASGTHDVDFGQASLWSNITELTNFKQLNTANITPAPTVTDPSAYFATVVYTGDTNNNRNITGFQDGAGDNVTPDLVWIKSRSNTTSHYLQDAVREFGGSKELMTDSSAIEGSNGTGNGYIGDVIAGGFTAVDGGTNDVYVNENGRTYVAWMWKAGGEPTTDNDNTSGAMDDGSVFKSGVVQSSYTPSGSPSRYPKKMSIAGHGGFSMVEFVGTGANATVPHGLDSNPGFFMIKCTSHAKNWGGWHEAIGAQDKFISWQTTNGMSGDQGGVTWQNNPVASSHVITLGSQDGQNGSGETHIMYSWAKVPGMIGIGTYIGNGAADGTYVVVDDGASGFRPAWVMVKRLADGYAWHIQDSTRSPYNPTAKGINANDTGGDSSSTGYDFISNGFKLRAGSDGGYNGSGATYIYLAFAEQVGIPGESQARAR